MIGVDKNHDLFKFCTIRKTIVKCQLLYLSAIVHQYSMPSQALKDAKIALDIHTKECKFVGKSVLQDFVKKLQTKKVLESPVISDFEAININLEEKLDLMGLKIDWLSPKFKLMSKADT